MVYLTFPRLRRVGVALLTAAFAFSGVFASGGVVGRPEGEVRDHLWVLWGVSRSVAAGESPLLATWAGTPGGVPLYPLDPLNHALFALLTPLLGPVAALNVLAFLLYTLLVYGGQKLAARSGAGVVAELLTGLLAATAPAFLGPFADSQTEGMAAGWLLMLLSELFGQQPRPLRASLWGAALLASAPYPAHAVAVVVAVVWLLRRLPMAAALPALIAGVAAAALLYTTETELGGALHARQAHLAQASAPPRSSPLGVAAPPPLPDDGVVRHAAPYPGAAETGPRREAGWMLGGIVLVALAWRPSRAPAVLALGYAAVAAGNRLGGSGLPTDFLTPYELFWRYYPLARYAWKPAQYVVPAVALALVAFALAWRAAGGRGRLVLGGLAVAALAETSLRSSTPLPLPASTLHPRAAWVALAENPDVGAVIEYPCRDRGVPGRPPVADVLLGPLWHGRALGETPNRGTSGPHRSLLDGLEAAASGRPSDLSRALREARAAGFGHLLLLGAQLPADAVARLSTALAEAGATPSPVDPEGTLHVALPTAP